VVVPCYRVEEFLDECLDSLRSQRYRDVELVVVDDGSPDRSAQIAGRHARVDGRVVLVSRENGGLSAARNTGVAHAHGEFLAFVDSDDTVTPEGFSSAIEALQRSGSDFAMFGYDRLRDGRRTPAGRWIRRVHRTRRLGVDLDRFPEAMVNAIACSKVFRREFWDREGLRFPEGRIYEDQPVTMRAFARARAFDVVPETGLSWRYRNDRSSISQRPWSAASLAAHNEAVAASLAALTTAGKERAAQIRALQVLEHNLPFFIRHLPQGDAAFRLHLREGVGALLTRVPREDFVHRLAAQDKVLLELVARDRHDDAVWYVAHRPLDVSGFPTVSTPDGQRVDLPFSEGLPDDACLLSDRQLRQLRRTGSAGGARRT
jgi:CDP-glycerol glycerophosphotransferase